jgi:acetyltransferase-like isoleucine patch superfamily enzyme
MLAQFLSTLVSRLRGTPFQIDPRVPSSHLVGLICSYVLRRIRGWWCFPLHTKPVFIGRRSQIIGRSRIALGGALNVGDLCTINAISEKGISFGANVSLQRGVVIECTGSLQKLGRGVTLGRNVGVGSNSFLGAAGGIEIGDDTIVGNFVSFHSENHNAERLDVPIRQQGVRSIGIRVGHGCWIGAKATLLDGAVIGDGCIVAAGAVVTAGDYGDHVVLGGVPARVLRRRGVSSTA